MTMIGSPGGGASAQAGTFAERIVWTAELMEAVLPLTPEQVFDLRQTARFGPCRQNHPAFGIGWRWVDLAQRLCFLYGPDEAIKRLNAPTVDLAVAA